MLASMLCACPKVFDMTTYCPLNSSVPSRSVAPTEIAGSTSVSSRSLSFMSATLSL
jgi:hypothetical protein